MGKYRIETEDGHSYEVETEDATPSYPTPKLPSGLEGPAPGNLKQAIQNIPGSAIRAVTNPYGPGIPQGNPQFNDGEYHGPTPESVGNEIKGLIPHPVDDPVGTALQIATLGKYRRPIAKTALGATTGAVKGATEMIPMRHYGVPMDVPAPIAGAAAGGFAGWLSHLPYGREVGAALGAASPLVKGAVSGVRDAFDKGPEMSGPPPIGKPASRFDPSQYNSPQAVKPPVEVGGSHIPDPINSPLEETAPPETTKGAPSKGRFSQGQYDSPKMVKPPVETGGAHIPDYQGPTIQPPVTPERTPIWKSAQDAAAHNAHLPEVTQGDEFKPPVVQPPVPPMPAGGLQTAGPGSVQPPATGPQMQPVQPFSPKNPVASSPVGNAPTPAETPANGTVEMPKNTSIPKGGQEFPGGPATESAVDVIRPNTAPSGEEMIPREGKNPDEIISPKPLLKVKKISAKVRGPIKLTPKEQEMAREENLRWAAEEHLKNQAKSHAELVKLFEEFKKRHSK